MKKLVFLFVFTFSFFNSLLAQDKSELAMAKIAIQDLIKLHSDSLKQNEKKKFVKLFGLNLSNGKAIDSYPFTFGRGGVLRFYLCTAKGQVKLQLIQSNWRDERKTKVVLLEAKSKSQNKVMYYDYKVPENNDFELLLTADGDASAIVSAVQIMFEGDHYFYRKENKVVIINGNDTIVQYY